MKFDISKPHGLVYGVSGAAYEQHGQLYSITGEPVDESKEESDTESQPARTIIKKAQPQ